MSAGSPSIAPGRPLAGRSAVVTGGASGIGLAISERLARDGAGVAIFDVDVEAGRAAAERISGEGGRCIARAVDVSARDQVDAGVQAARGELGRIEILVNNAGIEDIGPFVSVEPDAWGRIFAVNVFGMFHCTQAVVPDMIDAGWGRIINISSSSAQRGSRGMVAYSASKGAVISFTRSLALELGPHGVTVNNIPPNFVVTPMFHKAVDAGHIPADFMETQAKDTPVGRPGRPEDIAAACAFLASPESAYITAQTIGVNGGRFP